MDLDVEWKVRLQKILEWCDKTIGDPILQFEELTHFLNLEFPNNHWLNQTVLDKIKLELVAKGLMIK